MVENDHFFPKATWRRMVWERGWHLEDIHWRIDKCLYRQLDLLSGVCPSTRYLTWWMVSDTFPRYTKECEILAKIICHASVLRGDDFKYKNVPGTSQMCVLCDDFEVEDARHFILRCSYFANERNAMLNEISQIDNDANQIFVDNNCDMLYTILGKPHAELDDGHMMAVWLIILKYVSIMYKRNVKSKSGIG